MTRPLTRSWEENAMKEAKLTMGQLLAAVYLSLTALSAEALPGKLGGGGLAWVAPLVLLVFLLPLAGFLVRRERTGFLERLGRGPGRVLAALFLLWGIFLLGVNAARSAQRLAAGGGEGALLVLLILAMGVWMAWGKVAAFGRSCELFMMAFGLGLGLVILFALFRIRPDYVLLATHGELAALPGGLLATTGIAAVGIFALFLGEDVTPREQDRGKVPRWTAALLITQALLLLLTLGRLGPALSALVERPFFQMVAGIGLAGAFQRLEALISALWLLGDLALVGLLLLACRRLLGLTVGKRERGWFALVPALAALFLAWGFLGRDGATDLLLTTAVPIGGLVVGLAAVLCWCWRGRQEGQKDSFKETEKK